MIEFWDTQEPMFTLCDLVSEAESESVKVGVYEMVHSGAGSHDQDFRFSMLYMIDKHCPENIPSYETWLEVVQ